jgi:hypothetical protein
VNETLKAEIIDMTGGSVRNHHVHFRGASGPFPDHSLRGSNASAAGRAIGFRSGGETIQTDVDETKAIFREPGSIRELFEREDIVEGDLILIERTGTRAYRFCKATKRGFNYYL